MSLLVCAGIVVDGAGKFFGDQSRTVGTCDRSPPASNKKILKIVVTHARGQMVEITDCGFSPKCKTPTQIFRGLKGVEKTKENCFFFEKDKNNNK